MAKLAYLGIIAAALLGLPCPETPSLAQIPNNICQSSFRTVQTGSGGSIPVRTSNQGQARALGRVADGTEVLFNLSDRNNEWAEITTPQGLQGWVPLDVLLPPSTVGSFQGSMRVRTLDGGPVNLRSQPSLNGPIIVTVPAGQTVKYLRDAGYWGEVRTPTGQQGYISNQFLVCP